MSVVAEIGLAARAVAERVDGAVVSIGTDRRGSGVVIAPNRVVTNAHNLADRTTLVTFADGQARQGRVLGSDIDGDLAVLEVDTATITPVALPDPAAAGAADGNAAGAEPAAAGLGDLVLAASRSSDGLRLTVGFVSGTGRSFRGPRGRRIMGGIEHSAPLARGASGGPLLSPEGVLLAINTHRVDRGFYLARPTDAAMLRRLEDLQAGKTVRTRVLGVALAPADVAARLRRSVGLSERTGLLVRAVEPESAAGRAGMGEGDLLVRAGNAELLSVDDLHRALAEMADDSLVVGILRGAEELTVTVVFEVKGADPEPG